jgi:hypothetical protein
MQSQRGVALRAIRPPRPDAGEGFLWCGTCRQFRDDSEFGWDTARDQPKRTCRPCAADRQRRYVAENRDKVNVANRIRKRGLTLEQYEAMVAEQGGRCAICKRERQLDIDHCHDTQRVRGLLCGPCNRALGFVDDDPAILRAAIRYLER